MLNFKAFPFSHLCACAVPPSMANITSCYAAIINSPGYFASRFCPAAAGAPRFFSLKVFHNLSEFLIMITIRTVDLWITCIVPLQRPFLLLFPTWRARTLPQHLLLLSLSFPSEPVVFTKLPVIFQSCFRRTIVRSMPVRGSCGARKNFQ